MREREGWHAAEVGELSPQQLRVLELMAAGRTNYEIAEALGLTLDGAKYHVREILGKLGVESREEAVTVWRTRRGIRSRAGRFARAIAPLGIRLGAGATALGLAGMFVLVLLANGVFGADSHETAGAATEGAPTATAATAPPASPTGETFGKLPAPGPLGLLAFVKDGDIWAKALPAGQEVQITEGGQDSQPAPSPSGRWLTFQRGAKPWLLDAAGNGRPLSATTATWAPSDDRLAIQDDGELSVLDVASGKAVRLGEGSSPIWSPSGMWIAALGTSVRWAPGSPPLPLVIIDPTSGSRRVVTAALPRGDDWSGDVRLLRWSGDGKEILFLQNPILSLSAEAGGLYLWSVPASGGTPVKLNDGMLGYPDYLAVMPGSSVIFVTEGAGRMAWDGKQLTFGNLPNSPGPVGNTPAGSAASVAWSPDGRYMGFVSGPSAGDISGGDAAHALLMQRRIYVLEFAASMPPRKLLDDPGYRDDFALWSNDGGRLLVARFSSDDVASLWLVSADGKQATKVADSLGPFDTWGSTWFGYYGHVQWNAVFGWQP